MTEPRVLNGRYQLDRLLGRGGMADVYLAKDIRLGRTVAIKLLRSDLARDPQFQARFRREAQAVAGLNHPSIVAVYDTGDAPSDATGHNNEQIRVPYIVMEYVEGKTLREFIRHDELSIDHAIDYTLGVLSALEYSHRAGIVHRDIKPANVMVTKEGSTVKVMDFGIARAIADSSATMTQTQAVIGTAQYLSPEQARGETVDARSDLYSAACLFYEMLTGRPPFVGDSPVSVAYQHVRETAEAPSHFNAEVSPALDSVLARALQKDRQDRFQDAAAFRRALRAAKAGVELAAAKPAEVSTDKLAAEIPTKLPAAVVSEPVEPATRAMAKVLSGGALTTESTEEEPEQVPLTLFEPEDVDHSTRRRRRAWIITLFVVLLLVLGGGGFFLFNQMTAKPPATPTVQIPSVAGKPETDALIALSNVQLKPQVERVNSDTVAAGIAIGTDPAAASTVDINSSITVKISKGPASITIPASLAKMTESAARDTLRQLGLNPGNTTIVNDPLIDQGLLVSTSPAVGTKVGAGSTVDLNISSGKVTMPQLIGKTKDEVVKLLKEASPELQVTFVEKENSLVDAGKATDQDPAANTDIDQDGSVTVTLAKAPEKPTPTPTSSPSCSSTASPEATGSPSGCPSPTPSE